MTILPAKCVKDSNSEVPQENALSNQQRIGLNIAPSRLNHNSVQLRLNSSQGHSQGPQEPSERQIWTRQENLQHSRPNTSHSSLHNQHNTIEDTPSSSKKRTYAFSSIPNVKERYYRNLERKRIREQKQESEREIDQKIECELKLDLVTKSPSSSIQNNDNINDDSALRHREDTTGYNSEDEYREHPSEQITEEEWRQRDLVFTRSLKKQGFVVKPIVEDGACLFRAIADQVYGDQDMHSVVRRHCMDYILKNRDFYCAYVTEDINKYVSRKRHDFVQGNHLEIQALSEMYNRSIEVYCYQLKPINIFHGAQQSDYEPIRLSYQRASHYNSITNPFNPSVGVGLGLPSYESEDMLLEQAMMEDKLKATDWEATNEIIEEQVARESYLQWYKDNEKRRKQHQANCSSAGSSSTIPSAACGTSTRSGGTPRVGSSMSPNTSQASPGVSTQSPQPENFNSSPVSGEHTSSTGNLEMACYGSSSSQMIENNSGAIKEPVESFCETDSIFSRLPPEVFGLRDWEDANVMARVLAATQQEYLDNLKAARNQNREISPGASTSSSR